MSAADRLRLEAQAAITAYERYLAGLSPRMRAIGQAADEAAKAMRDATEKLTWEQEQPH